MFIEKQTICLETNTSQLKSVNRNMYFYMYKFFSHSETEIQHEDKEQCEKSDWIIDCFPCSDECNVALG